VTAAARLRLPSVVRAARAAIGAELALAIAVIVYVGCHDIRDVFVGIPRAVSSGVAASCVAPLEADRCDVSITELNRGRYRIATKGPSGKLAVILSVDDAARTPQLLVRVSQPHSVELMTRPTDQTSHVELTDSSGRVVVSVPASSTVALDFVASTREASGPIVVDELAVFDSNAGLLADLRPAFRYIPPLRYHGTLVPRAVAVMCFFTILAVTVVRFRTLDAFAPIVLAAIAFSLSMIDLGVLYSPYAAQDLRAFYAGGPLTEPPGANLNGGVWQGFRLLEGKGLTLIDGKVSWERMPGYGLFCALAGALFGHRTLLELSVSAVLLQVLFYAAAVGVFAWAARGVMPAAAVWALGVLLGWLPKQVGLTQVDAVIAPIVMILLAALCVRLKRVRDGASIPLSIDVAVHAAFTLWFAMRPDVLPGWLMMSLFLHWKDLRRLLIPLVLFVAIGSAWGAYKARYTGEFTLTTTSAGASLFCGLWEVPSRFRFAEACTDERYFGWIQENTPYHPQTAAASSFATREVVRFWLTYPGHVVVMVAHKLIRMLDGDLWPGYPTELQATVFRVVARYWIVVALLTVVALSVVVRHELHRTLMFGWPLLFDAPIFWVMYASLGRFYSAVGVALLASAVPPLFERSFYGAVVARPWRSAAVVVCGTVFALTAWTLHDWLLANDAFHYWTPWLQPSHSTLSTFK